MRQTRPFSQIRRSAWQAVSFDQGRAGNQALPAIRENTHDQIAVLYRRLTDPDCQVNAFSDRIAPAVACLKMNRNQGIQGHKIGKQASDMSVHNAGGQAILSVPHGLARVTSIDS